MGWVISLWAAGCRSSQTLCKISGVRKEGMEPHRALRGQALLPLAVGDYLDGFS